MTSRILLGLAILCAGCGGAGNDDKPKLAGHWVGYVFTDRANPTDITIAPNNDIAGTVDGSPVTGVAGPSQIFLSGVGEFRYTLTRDKIEGLYIHLERQ